MEDKKNNITVGNVSGIGIAIGTGATAKVIASVNSTLDGVTQSIGTIPQADDSAKAELVQLVAQLKDSLKKVPQDKAEDAEAIAKMTEALVNAASAEKPNKTMIQITGDGLKKAAKNIGDVIPAVLGIATKIVATIAAFVV